MWQFLREINQHGTTIILTTHYLEEAESLCRHIAIINNGLTIASSAMKSLLMKLHVETFIFNLKQPLQAPLEIAGYRISRIDETTLEVEISKEQSINSVFEALGRAGIEVLSMRNKTNRLEEMFMHLVETGQL
jgi:ABC-2 type transport system ATP-binding protein